MSELFRFERQPPGDQRCDSCDAAGVPLAYCPSTHDDDYVGVRVCAECLRRASAMLLDPQPRPSTSTADPHTSPAHLPATQSTTGIT